MTSTPDTSWLDGTTPAGDDWLDAPTVRVESSGKAKKERGRFQSMAKKLVGRSRVWACDGEYVAFRRKMSNPATLQRHEQFLKTGDYKHIGTYDDVEVYELQASSPFKREVVDFTEMVPDRNRKGSYQLKWNFSMVRRYAVLAACRRDFGLFVDALQELAGRLKGTYHEAQANMMYQDELVWIFHLINLRGGPGQVEIDHGVQSVRQRRGEDRNRVLMLPPARTIVQ